MITIEELKDNGFVLSEWFSGWVHEKYTVNFTLSNKTIMAL